MQTSTIKTVYIYFFSFLGLIFMAISLISFLDMGLKAYVFTKADQDQKLAYSPPPTPYIEEIENLKEKRNITEAQKINIDEWLADYEKWQSDQGKIDYVVSSRHEQAANNLAMLLVGLPMYLYHWRLAKKESKN
ncbi:hypothetical protein HYV44_01585 [Candidatus Microgenomates bacterium]|nr:hypothetical protein [Candidatus Microgenomates bacterium]